MLFLLRGINEDEQEREGNFSELAKILEDLSRGFIAGIYHEGKRDERGRKIEPDYLMIDFVIGKKRYEKMYKVGYSTRRRKIIRE